MHILNIFLTTSLPIHLIFGILITITTRSNVISKSSIILSFKNVSMSLNCILYSISFGIYLQFCLDLYSAYSVLTSVNVRLSYCFKALLLWILSSLLSILCREWTMVLAAGAKLFNSAFGVEIFTPRLQMVFFVALFLAVHLLLYIIF